MEEEKEPFRIVDLSTLNWTFKQLSNLQQKENEIRSFAKAERDKLNEWEKKELDPIENQKEYFDHLIQSYHFEKLREDPKAKTLSTPYGSSKSRASKAAPEQADKESLLSYIQENNMRDYIKEDVKWGDFKKTLTVAELEGAPVVVDENGQVVPGVVVKPEAINYSVEITD